MLGLYEMIWWVAFLEGLEQAGAGLHSESFIIGIAC
jgi:hypothetical protein